MSDSPIDPAAWTLVEGSIEGCPALVRIRTGIDELVGSSERPRRLSVSWEFQAGATGRPEDETEARMEELERLLAPALEGEVGVLAFVFTCDGLRHWHYYVPNTPAVLEARIASALGEQVFPIEVDIENDPAWEGYTSVREAWLS